MRRVVIVTALLTLAAAALACAPAAPPAPPAAVVEQQTAPLKVPHFCAVYIEITASPDGKSYGKTTDRVSTCYFGQDVLFVIDNPLDLGNKKIPVRIDFPGSDPFKEKLKEKKVGSEQGVVIKALFKPEADFSGACDPATQKPCYFMGMSFDVYIDGNKTADPDLQVEPPPTIIIPGGNPPPKK